MLCGHFSKPSINIQGFIEYDYFKSYILYTKRTRMIKYHVLQHQGHMEKIQKEFIIVSSTSITLKRKRW